MNLLTKGEIPTLQGQYFYLNTSFQNEKCPTLVFLSILDLTLFPYSCNQPEQHEIKILLKFANKDLYMNLQQ